MRLSDEIAAIEAHADGLDQIVKSLRERLRYAQESWPDHQIVPCSDWHSRDETPPKGMIWASNGTSVWLIRDPARVSDVIRRQSNGERLLAA